MAVYVDDMYRYKIGRYGRMKMSHMVADTLGELLEMADAIGLQRRWLQYPGSPRRRHFDVSMSKRRMAVEMGATEMTMIEMGRMLRDKWGNDDD